MRTRPSDADTDLHLVAPAPRDRIMDITEKAVVRNWRAVTRCLPTPSVHISRKRSNEDKKHRPVVGSHCRAKY
jgi:hypothetical protein